ncbi:MAG: D-alanyl-D-alanine carboxypeptidase/D-alanyl-D-alanine-endopeptidase [Chloracidobacterium sp.]|nr:D-alanyl-D-alanine carboxypeptidase/D-alanyl-D-alanine-endopeptidase [Chloracidobacterium sp.]
MKVVKRFRFDVLPLQIVLAIGFATVAVWAQAPNSTRATASPTPAASPIKSPTPVQTLDDLRAKIRNRMLSPEAARGRVGIKITSLNSGKVIFENDAEKYFIPASNMKNFTVAAALEKLGPDFRFVTSVYAAAKPDASGTIKGDLRIFGRGDISISTAFNNGDYYKGIDNLVDKIVAAGVKRIEGDLVGDESYFKGNAVPYTWEWDDLQWYDGAEISALPVNNNALDLTVKPGASTGGQCVINILPQTSLMPIVNTCTTTSASQPRTLKVFKPLGRNVLEISGMMPSNDKGFTGYIAITRPAEMFIELLRQRLLLKNIVFTGKTRIDQFKLPNSEPVEITTLESPPFSLIAAKTMKPSQNMFTETILWTLGERLGRQSSATAESSTLGINVVKDFINQIGIPRDAVLHYDGSGMSRHDQVTPSAVVTLYTYMTKQSKNAQVWRDSLTVGGVDGTLSRRFAGTAAAGNMRGKTGTLDQVSALSGYLTTAGGEQIVVSVIVNGIAETRGRTSLIDDIVVQLANFKGKID